MGNVSVWMWAGFFALVLAMLAVDLGVSRRRTGAMSLRTAALWSAVWIGTALLFNLAIYLWRGPEPALEFFTAYLIEKALSVDNLFVFVVIFATFGVPALYQRRVLFWGVLGALIMSLVILRTTDADGWPDAVLMIVGSSLIWMVVKAVFLGWF